VLCRWLCQLERVRLAVVVLRLYRGMHQAKAAATENCILALNRQILRQGEAPQATVEGTAELIQYQAGELATLRVERDELAELSQLDHLRNTRFARTAVAKLRSPRSGDGRDPVPGPLPVFTGMDKRADANAGFEGATTRVSALQSRLGRVFEMAGL
jgi:hypothetical protein